VARPPAGAPTADGATRQRIARAHINDFVQQQLGKRIFTAMISGQGDPSSASLIKLSLGIIQPLRAAAAMEIAGPLGVAWSGDGSAGHAASVGFLNGRIMSIAGGSNEIQRNIVSERLLGLPREPSVDADKSFREVLRDARSWGKPAG
jgi:alkylation response protein AidB-like acyl-CoA dehydrogenase